MAAPARAPKHFLEVWITSSATVKTALSFVAVSMLSAILMVVIVAIVYEVWPDNTFAPLYGSGYSKPQPVAERYVQPGGVIHTTAVKCSSMDVDVYGQISYHRIEPTVLYIQIDPVRSTVRKKGCETLNYENKIPPDLAPGLWEIVGSETAVNGLDEQRLYWQTERFTVTAQ